ncbi:hypothetical protein CK203_100454 [Vitis vinifera]|uniref:Uncharacterized protein n=1 Tax=Vitis vinifera TaxID=29760 RepID=A0A438CV03_VITVI|nr:hypothetical protein CK203_100454 [Vitis vinifera]
MGGKCGTDMKKVDNRQLSQPTGSQISEVLQSDGGNMNSPKEANGNLSKLLGSELCPVSGLQQQITAATPKLNSKEDCGFGVKLLAPNPILAATK